MREQASIESKNHSLTKYPKYTADVTATETEASIHDVIGTFSTQTHKQEPPQFTPVCISSLTTRSSSRSDKNSPLESLDVSLLSEIILLVGPNQYRFVALINRNFRTLHAQLFPQNTNTYINISTLKHAQIVFEEMKYISYYDKYLKTIHFVETP